MSTGAIIGIIILIIIVVAVALVVSAGLRRARMRRQFGPEYDRLAQELGSRNKADTELAARQRRVQALGIHELSPDQQASYSGDWTAVQERFVDTPVEAVGAADALVWTVMRDRGYPVNDRDASMEALSVYHARPLAGYRQVMDLPAGSATTEQLREAMIRYRALFEDLTGLREVQGQPGRDRVAEIREGAAENRGLAAQDGGVAAQDGGVAAQDGGVAAQDGGVAAQDGGVAAQDGGVAAQDGEPAAENTDRTADTPR